MGPEITAAIIAPMLGGVVSLILWQARKNSEGINTKIDNVHSCLHQVERKVTDISVDIAKNYVRNEDLTKHIESEEEWHQQHHDEVKELRQEFNEKTERMSHDIALMKDTQWKIRMDQLKRMESDNKEN